MLTLGWLEGGEHGLALSRIKPFLLLILKFLKTSRRHWNFKVGSEGQSAVELLYYFLDALVNFEVIICLVCLVSPLISQPFAVFIPQFVRV